MWGLVLHAIFGLGIVSIAAIGAGAWIPTALPTGFRRFERVAFVLLGGLGTLSTILFFVGLWSFTRTSIITILSIAALAGIVSVGKVFAKGASKNAAVRSPKPPLIAVTIVALVLLATAVSGLAEITGDWGNDTVAYHLLGPKVWLRNGVIRPVLDNSHTAFPQIPETIFAVLWSVGGSSAPNFSSFVTFGLLLAVSASLALRCGLNNSQAWWVAALIAAMPAVYAGSHGCFVDGIFAAFVIAAARIGLGAQTIPEWAIFGMFGGFAIGTKYTGLLAFPVLLIGIALFNFRNEKRESLARVIKVAAAIIAAIVVGAPYYAKNWLLLGCAIYPPPPDYASFCSPRYFPADAIAQFISYIRVRGFGMGRGVTAFLLLPFNLTYHTANFHGAGGIGLAPFALAPIGIVRFRRDRLVRAIVLLMFLLTLVWFVTQQESRFLIHVYAMGAILAVWGWNAVYSGGRKISNCFAVAILAISLSYGLFMIQRASASDIHAVFSPNYAALRRQTEIPYFDSMDYLNKDPAVRRILILDRSVMPFYLNKGYVKPVGQWGERTLPNGIDSLQAVVLAEMHQLDVSHVLDVSSPAAPFLIDPNSPQLTLVFQTKNQRVYRLD